MTTMMCIPARLLAGKEECCFYVSSLSVKEFNKPLCEFERVTGRKLYFCYLDKRTSNRIIVMEHRY